MKERHLLFSLTAKDFDFQFFAAASAGGQHANRRHTNCRCVHIASGAVGICCDERSQSANKEMAFTRCCESKKFKDWHKGECARQLQKLGINQVDTPEKVGAGFRSEKFRTYNVKDNRVTNHMSGNSFYNLDDIINGRLDEIIEDNRLFMERLKEK